MTTSPSRPSLIGYTPYYPAAPRMSVHEGTVWIETPTGPVKYPLPEPFEPGSQFTWQPLDPASRSYRMDRIRTAMAARRAAAGGADPASLGLFGQQVLGLKRSERWTEAVSTALLGTWGDNLAAGFSSQSPLIDQLLQEAREIHTQLVPLWQRRTYGNRRVLLLEKPSAGGGTLRDLLADRHLPDNPLLDQVPGDRRLAAVLARLAPAEQAVVLAFGHPGVATWVQAAELTGADQPATFAERVRTKVKRIVKMLQQQDQQRIDGPTGLWTPRASGGAR
ncbi:hypothetical protein KNE206_30360 [Kitasatospora sp. NE20-6]|uniref:hypothetical protein n=1 Tax=Kitasatospora sp. NE20-6 TaxID=2859066 RepID=UPI0034DBE07A